MINFAHIIKERDEFVVSVVPVSVIYVYRKPASVINYKSLRKFYIGYCEHRVWIIIICLRHSAMSKMLRYV